MSLIIAILILGVLIFIHELGHLLAGLSVGIKADAFSIGFGPVLLKKEIKGISFRLSLIPFGGYCAFGENGRDNREDFINIKPLKRIWIYFAGPFFNFLFAVIILTVLVSMPSVRTFQKPVISVFTDGKYLNSKEGITLFYEQGFKSGDIINYIDDTKINSDYDFYEYISNIEKISKAENITFKLIREGENIDIVVPALDILQAVSGGRELGIFFSDSLKIKQVMNDSAAFEAGILAGDEVVAVNGNKVYSIADFRPVVMDNASMKITITVLRNGTELIREAIPRQVKTKNMTYGSMGITFDVKPYKEEKIPGVAFPKSIGKAFGNSISYLKSYLNGLKLLFTGKLSLRDNLGGPVKIVQITSQVVSSSSSQRLSAILSLASSISLILFFMNLLPLPVVDGGMIVLALIEFIIRKPLNRTVVEKIQTVGAFFLITLAIFITVNDITQLFR